MRSGSSGATCSFVRRSSSGRRARASASRRSGGVFFAANVRENDRDEAWIEKLEQAPELAEVVLDRRAAKREAMTSAKEPARFRHLAGRVLDRLRFVENDVFEFGLRQLRDVEPHRRVGRQDYVGVGEVVLATLCSMMLDDPQLRRETFRLGGPIEQ
jgi:hypothetical protein